MELLARRDITQRLHPSVSAVPAETGGAFQLSAKLSGDFNVATAAFAQAFVSRIAVPTPFVTALRPLTICHVKERCYDCCGVIAVLRWQEAITSSHYASSIYRRPRKATAVFNSLKMRSNIFVDVKNARMFSQSSHDSSVSKGLQRTNRVPPSNAQ
jgi:hypothetical protein